VIRYAVYPGHVLSATDGQWHHIGARTLMFLYDVPPSECIVAPTRDQPVYVHASFAQRVKDEHLTILTPREDGDYSLNK
jgi:hypothetical protein